MDGLEEWIGMDNGWSWMEWTRGGEWNGMDGWIPGRKLPGLWMDRSMEEGMTAGLTAPTEVLEVEAIHGGNPRGAWRTQQRLQMVRHISPGDRCSREPPLTPMRDDAVADGRNPPPPHRTRSFVADVARVDAQAVGPALGHFEGDVQ